MHRVPVAVVAWALVASGLAAACAPAFDWREVRVPGAPASAWFPCKPVRATRTVRIAGADVAMALQRCDAGGLTWALAAADVADPARVTQALLELKHSAARNLGADGGAGAVQVRLLAVPGATPNPASGAAQIDGRRPDGVAVSGQLAVFTYGTWVFQATVLGQAPAAEAAQTFFDSLRAGA